MGQRHQIYIVSKDKGNYNALGAFHHQWNYGLTATVNAVRLAKAVLINKTLFSLKPGDWSDYRIEDSREIDVLVKSIYGVDLDGRVSMVHNENEYLIEKGVIKPELGDNNDGAALIVIDNDFKEVRLCLFTPGHVEGEFGDDCKPWTVYGPLEYLNFYYRGVKLLEIFRKNKRQAQFLDDNSSTRMVTQKEFDEILQRKPKKKRAPKVKEKSNVVQLKGAR